MGDTVRVVTVDDVLAHLGIDYADDMASKNIDRIIDTADYYLKSAVGENYPVDHPAAKEIALHIIEDLYENRGLSSKVSNNTKNLIDNLSLQLLLELRRESDE